jgi:catechol 2,3-dioxygenase-like lactoylglutathione lyase family enzyme
MSKLGWPTWIGVVVDDLDAQRRFYRDVLGLEETGGGDDWVHFDFGGKLLELLQRDASVPQYDARRVQVGFTVEDIHAARDQLAAAGAELISDVEGGPRSGNLWCYFRDPEGNVFEITQWLGRAETTQP